MKFLPDSMPSNFTALALTSSSSVIATISLKLLWCAKISALMRRGILCRIIHIDRILLTRTRIPSRNLNGFMICIAGILVYPYWKCSASSSLRKAIPAIRSPYTVYSAAWLLIQGPFYQEGLCAEALCLQMSRYRRRTNQIPLQSLDWLSPIQKRNQLA